MLKNIITISLILFSVIDIIGSLPIILNLRKRIGHIESEKATIVAGSIMILFLFGGESLLNFIGIDVSSFAVAGSIVLLLLGLEMVLGQDIFKADPEESKTASIVPIAFPLIAGAGTMTTIITLKAEYADLEILAGVILNLLLVYLVLKSSKLLEQKVSPGFISILRKVFGIILIAIAVKIFKTNVFL